MIQINSMDRITRNDNQDAVSEIVGALALIVVIGVAVAIIATSMVSSIQTGNIPAANIQVTTDGTDLFLIHAGGDSLDKSSIHVYVDDTDRTSFFIDESGSLDWTSWDAGEKLILPEAGSSMPEVTITWMGRGKSALLYGKGVAYIP